MNLDDLTIGQARELAAMFGTTDAPKTANPLLGKFVIVRCKDAGVHAGNLKSQNGRECYLTESRRLWYWESKKGSFLSGVAVDGITENSKIGAPVNIYLTETCELIECSSSAAASVQNAPTHERSK